MKIKYKIITILSIAICVLGITIQPAFAQGSFICTWEPNYHGDGKGACIPSGSCDSGYSPPLQDIAKCTAATNIGECLTGPFSCTKQPNISNQNQQPGALTDIEKAGLPGFKFAGLSVGALIQAALPWIFGIAGILLLLYLLYGGFHLMISGGEPKVVAEAKGKITNALIGFVIIFVAFWIVQIVAKVFGLTPIVDIFG